MCGIGGFINFKDSLLNQKNIESILSNQVHRGPDGISWVGFTDRNEMSFVKNNKIFNQNKKFKGALGCSRLAINDISSLGMQPIFSNSKKILVCMNGEIFNFLEIKRSYMKNISLEPKLIQK